MTRTAASQGDAVTLTALLAPLTSEKRLMVLTRPLESGIHAGITPLYVAALQGHADAVTAMLAPLTSEERVRPLLSPLKFGRFAGKTSISILYERDPELALTVMQYASRQVADKKLEANIVAPRGGARLFDHPPRADSRPNSRPPPPSADPFVEEDAQAAAAPLRRNSRG